MPHLRQRFIREPVLKALAWSPAVGVYGLRQVGKSTLVEAITARQKGLIESFDRSATLSSSQNRPTEFCDRDRLLCIDECQKGPWIFPVIKDIIGTRRKPGRFLLTGSLRFTLKKEIREALTGRIILFELLPFTLAEASHLAPSPFLKTCFDKMLHGRNSYEDLLTALQKARDTRRISLKQAGRHFAVGGMPIPCFSRDEERRKQWHEGFFETLITRDLALVDPGLSGVLPSQGLSFLRRLSLMQGEEVNYSALAASSALGLDKAKRLYNALVALCLIDSIVPECHALKSQRKMRVEWKDSGLWNYFNQISGENLGVHHVATSLFLSQELRFQLGLTKQMTHWSSYKSHNGASVPWIYRQGGRALALIYLPTENPTPYQYRALKQFITREPQTLGLILGSERAPFMPLDHRILLMPFTSVL